MAEVAHTLEWPYWPQEKQEFAWEAMNPFNKVKHIGYGGPKYGGKSHTIRSVANLHAHTKPLEIMIFGRNFEDLRDLHVEPIKQELQDYVEAGELEWRANEKLFRWKKTGSLIKIQQCNTPREVLRQNGKAYDIILVDEAQKLTEFELRYIQGSCRPSPTATSYRRKLRGLYIKAKTKEEKQQIYDLFQKSIYYPKILYCFNWGEAGHQYLYRVFWQGCSHEKKPYRQLEVYEVREQRKPDGSLEIQQKEKPENYHFIFAHWKHNKIGLQENPGYVDTLNAYPEPYRTAYKEGDPEAFAGLKFQIVDPIHDVDMVELLKDNGGCIPHEWDLLAALDPGTASPCSFAMVAVSPDGYQYQITDYYESGRSHERNAEGIYQDIVNCHLLRDRPLEDRMPKYIIAGKDAFARQSKNAIMGHNVTLKKIFWDKYRLRLIPAITDRIPGAMAVHNALDYEYDYASQTLIRAPIYRYAGPMPGLPEGCINTKKELRSLTASDTNKDDVKTGEGIEDHAYDRQRYFCMGAQRVKIQAPVAERDPELSDYGRHTNEFKRVDKKKSFLESVMGSFKIDKAF